jgi:hypothetical protein
MGDPVRESRGEDINLKLNVTVAVGVGEMTDHHGRMITLCRATLITE